MRIQKHPASPRYQPQRNTIQVGHSAALKSLPASLRARRRGLSIPSYVTPPPLPPPASIPSPAGAQGPLLFGDPEPGNGVTGWMPRAGATTPAVRCWKRRAFSPALTITTSALLHLLKRGLPEEQQGGRKGGGGSGSDWEMS